MYKKHRHNEKIKQKDNHVKAEKDRNIKTEREKDCEMKLAECLWRVIHKIGLPFHLLVWHTSMSFLHIIYCYTCHCKNSQLTLTSGVRMDLTSKVTVNSQLTCLPILNVIIDLLIWEMYTLPLRHTVKLSMITILQIILHSLHITWST